MRSRVVNGVEVTTSSGNVFADPGLPDAEQLKIKADLLVEIRKAMRALGLSQQEAGWRMGLPQQKISGLLRGDFPIQIYDRYLSKATVLCAVSADRQSESGRVALKS